MIRLSTFGRNLIVNGLTSKIDFAKTPGAMIIYSGAKPTNPNLPVSNAMVATLAFALPSFSPSGTSSGTDMGTPTPGTAWAVLQTGSGHSAVTHLTGAAIGTMSWFRILGGSGEFVADGQIAVSGGDLTVAGLAINGTLTVGPYAISIGETLGGGSSTFMLADATRNVVADTLGKNLNNGVMKIYAGSMPDHPDNPPSGTLLAIMQFSNPAYQKAGLVDIGMAVANGITNSGGSLASGIMGWFRCQDQNGNTLFDGNITPQGGGGDITFDTTTVSASVNVSLTSFPLQIPSRLS